nr:MAG TPA: Vpu protein [Caudoviricetes sp.]
MLEKLAIAGIVTLVVAYFIFIFIEATDYQDRKEKEKQEAIELRIKNARLEEQLKALDDKQAEQTKKTAELNGIGG